MNALRGWSPSDRAMTALCVAVILVAIGMEIVARKFHLSGPYWVIMGPDTAASYGLFSLVLYHMCVAGSRREIAAIAGMSLACGMLIRLAEPHFVRSDLQLVGYAAALGSACVQGWSMAAARNSREALLDRFRLARESTTLAIAGTMPTVYQQFLMPLNPTFDHVVAHFEDGLGVRFISLVRSSMESSPALSQMMTWVYGATPALLAVVSTVQRAAFPNVIVVGFVSAAAGFLFYFLVPVVGPPFTFPDYYASIWPIADPLRVAMFAVTDQPRNCMPSVHAAMAYVAMFAVYGANWVIRLAVALASALTLASAIHTGNHWFTDLVVAVPFAVAVQAFTSVSVPFREPARLQAFLGGLGMTLALLALICLEPLEIPYPTFFRWAAVVVPTATSIVLWRRLARRLVDETHRTKSIAMPRMRVTNPAI